MKRRLIHYIFLWLCVTSALALPQASSPSRAPNARTAPAATPQQPAKVSPFPAPTPASPQAAAPSMSGPQYSPFQLDFGTVDYNASARRTFSLKAPAAGDVTLQFPKGVFVAAELRRVPPMNQGSKAQSSRIMAPPMKPAPFSADNFSLLYKWNLAAGEEMQLDILFAPNSSKDASPGQRSASMDWSGPGNQPWQVHIPLRGVVAGPPVQLQANPQIAQSAQTKKPALTTPSSNAPVAVSALPTPSPGPPPPQGMALALNAPAYSPDKFDFGEVWDGDVTRKTLHLTTTASGYVTVQIPKGPFRVSEFREMGAVQAPSKNSGNKTTPNLGPFQPVKTRIKYLDGQSGPFQWSLAPDTDIQIDIAFQPHFNLFEEAAGQKSVTMKVTGPGPHGNWTLSVPLLGMFDGLKLSAPMVPQPKELYAFAGDKVLPVNVTLYGLDNDVSGAVKLGDNPPPGVSIVQKNLKVYAKQKNSATLWLSLGSFPLDGTPRPLELVFDDGSKKSKAQVQFTGLSNSRTFSSGNRTDCGIGDLSLTISIQAPQHSQVDQGFYIPDLDSQTGTPGSLKYQLQGSLNFVIKKYLMQSLWLAVESDGIQVFKDGFNFRMNADHVTETANIPLRLPGETWERILNGQARIGCLLSAYYREEEEPDALCINNGGCTAWKWAPALH